MKQCESHEPNLCFQNRVDFSGKSSGVDFRSQSSQGSIFATSFFLCHKVISFRPEIATQANELSAAIKCKK